MNRPPAGQADCFAAAVLWVLDLLWNVLCGTLYVLYMEGFRPLLRGHLESWNINRGTLVSFFSGRLPLHFIVVSKARRSRRIAHKHRVCFCLQSRGNRGFHLYCVVARSNLDSLSLPCLNTKSRIELYFLVICIMNAYKLVKN